MNALNLFYPNSSFKPFASQDKAEEFFNKSIIDKNLRLMLGKKYSDEKKEMIVKKVYEGKPLFFYIRSAEVVALSKISKFLWPPFYSMSVLSFSSTYSPGPGLFYGLLNIHGNYFGFMNLATAFNLLIFHLSVLIIFLLILKLNKNYWSAITIGVLALFSYSLYSYGYHLGSTVWNILVSTIFIWLVFYFYQNKEKNILQKISILSSVLLFFSYLVVIYWLAALMVLILLDAKNKVKVFTRKYVFEIIKSQKTFIICSLLCWLIIMPAGLSFHGNPQSFKEFLSFSYYIILNFFSFFSMSEYWHNFQFIVFGLALLGGLSCAYFFKKDKDNFFVFCLVVSVLVVYGIFAVLGILSFVPSRHILFLVPVLFVILYYFIDEIYCRLPIFLVIFFNAILVFGGFYSLFLSQKFTIDQTAYANVNSNPETVVVYGDNYQLLYRFADSPGSFLKKNNIPLSQQIKINTKYLYVSQSDCFDDLIADAARENMQINIDKKMIRKTNRKFIAFDPKNFAFNMPNDFCQAEFIWLK
jgi:hypothetical protein